MLAVLWHGACASSLSTFSRSRFLASSVKGVDVGSLMNVRSSGLGQGSILSCVEIRFLADLLERGLGAATSQRRMPRLIVASRGDSGTGGAGTSSSGSRLAAATQP